MPKDRLKCRWCAWSCGLTTWAGLDEYDQPVWYGDAVPDRPRRRASGYEALAWHALEAHGVDVQDA